jgi:hypothetical protein
MTRPLLPLLLLPFALAVLPGAIAAAPPAAVAAVGGTYQAALAQAVDDGVLDDAHLFSAEAATAARDRVRQIRKEYHVAVFIDTVSKAPASGWSDANSWNGRKRDDYFHSWAKQRSQELGVEGIHVLICKQPRHVAVVVWPERLEADFGPKECKGVEQMFTRRLVAAPDETLLGALAQVRSGLEAHREPEPPSVALGPLGVFIGGAVGVWLLLGLVRLRLRKPDPFSFTGEPQTVRLTAGLLAGMFGNPAAFWITDRLFPHDTTGSSYEMLVEDVPAAAVPASPEEASPAADADELDPMPEHAELKHE